MLLVAYNMNEDLDRRESRQEKINSSVDDLHRELSGRYRYTETKKEDRTGVYAVGGIGAMFILGGFITLSSRR